MRPALDGILRRLITMGRLTVRWPDGDTTQYMGSRPGPEATVALQGRDTVRRLLANPALEIGEAYMDQRFAPVECSLYEALDVLVLNARGHERVHPGLKWRMSLGRAWRRLDQFNPAARARRNVAHHYDLSGALYELFLDRDRQYSCAYFPRGDETLDEAQAAKKRHIADKLLLDRPGLRVLDIGCGWGGMALTLARDHGARVTGITLSTEQLGIARARAHAEGLDDRVMFQLTDYRAVEGQFDRIVSVGMFEHVGIGHYATFFRRLCASLAPDGVALLHSIGRSDGPASTNPWMAKYIFPGGYTPALSEVMPSVERSGLIVTDIEILRVHYAETLRHWHARFADRRTAAEILYDARFVRMFEFYFAACEIAFRRGGHMVFQMQLARRHQAVPITRDYLGAAARADVLATESAR